MSRASAFELYLPDFKKSDAAKAESVVSLEKAERVKAIRALARSTWDAMSPEEKAPYELRAKEAKEAKAKEKEEDAKAKGLPAAPKKIEEDPAVVEYRRCLALPANTGALTRTSPTPPLCMRRLSSVGMWFWFASQKCMSRGTTMANSTIAPTSMCSSRCSGSTASGFRLSPN